MWVKGDNDSKVSLKSQHRFLHIILKKIIMHANQRLIKHLTNNRYEMRRATEVLDRRRNEGLKIMVLDYNTGKRETYKITFGGGEKVFEAALALALGLAQT